MCEALAGPPQNPDGSGRGIALSRRLEVVGQHLAAIYQKEFLISLRENNHQSEEVIS